MEVDDYAKNFEYQPTRGTATPHLLLVLCQIIFLASPIFPGRKWLSISVLVLLAIWAQFSPFTHNPAAANFAALAWPHYLATIEKFLNTHPCPEAALWWIDKGPGEAVSYVPFGLQKLRWALVLLLNLRGIRWNFEVKNVQKPRFTTRQPRGRTLFLLWQLMELTYFMLMGDLVAQLGIRFFFTLPGGQSGRVNSRLIDIRDKRWLLSLLKALVFGSGPYFFINMQYTLASIIFVGTGITKPEDWPPLFGRLIEATSVRNFWGKFWHQMIRKPLQGLTGRVVDGLGIKRGTNYSSYTQLWLSFTISGFMHAASMTLMPCPANVTQYDRWTGLIIYFLWQAAAISMEDFVQFVWLNMFGEGEGGWKKIVGYLWVTCSFWLSLPFAADVLLKLKMGETSPFGWTVFGPLVEKLDT